MPLVRKKSLEQLKRIRNQVKKEGGDIADKTTAYDKKLPNIYWMHNPSDVKIDTQEDIMRFGNVEKINTKKMKHVKTFEQHDLLGTIKKMIDNGQINQEEALQIIDNQKMADIFKEEIKQYIIKYCRTSKIDSLDEGKEMDILRVGKTITVGDTQGIVNKLEGGYLYLEVGYDIKKFSLNDVVKKYKVLNESAMSMYNIVMSFLKYGIKPFQEEKADIKTASKFISELIDLSNMIKPDDIEKISDDKIKINIKKDNSLIISQSPAYISISGNKIIALTDDVKKLYNNFNKLVKKEKVYEFYVSKKVNTLNFKEYIKQYHSNEPKDIKKVDDDEFEFYFYERGQLPKNILESLVNRVENYGLEKYFNFKAKYSAIEDPNHSSNYIVKMSIINYIID